LALLQGFSPAETGWVTGYQRGAAGYVQIRWRELSDRSCQEGCCTTYSNHDTIIWRILTREFTYGNPHAGQC
jgi:hypothetical protein